MENNIETLFFNEKETIFEQGQHGNRCYLIISGTVEIFRFQNETTIKISEVGKGELFGEMALIDSSPRMATAKAASDVMVYSIEASILKKKIEEADPFIAGLVKNLTAKARDNINK